MDMVGIEKMSADFTMHQAQHVSTLFALLPGVLQDCLPRLPSLRHSIYGFSQLNKSSNGETLPSNGHRTIMSRFSRKMLDSPHKDFVYSDDDRELHQFFDETSDGRDDSYICEPQPDVAVGMSGVDWRCAQQGLSLLNLAISESTTHVIKSTPVARQFYLHSLIYLVRALPPDLTNDEQQTIRGALSESVVKPFYPKILSPSYRQSSRSAIERRSTSLLHRILASTIVQLFIFFQFLLPHIKFLLAKAWAYEKEHQVVRRITRKSIDFGMGVGEVMRGMGEGKVGEIMAGSIEWFLLGVVGGVEEGLAVISSISRKESGVVASSKVG
ncbi:hypothetical protein K3495_g9881 [Podosphaera aphanis]|nr:hypothetical protein K3495_g9881 [Podosphaera aphanis]